MIRQVNLNETTYQDPPLRFEAGTPIIGPVIALKAALEFVEQNRRPDLLLPYATKRLQAISRLKIIGTAPEKGPILTFHIEGIHPLDLATLLDLKNISIRSGHLCAQPLLSKLGLKSVARASFGLYNSLEEVDVLADSLRALLS